MKRAVFLWYLRGYSFLPYVFVCFLGPILRLQGGGAKLFFYGSFSYSNYCFFWCVLRGLCSFSMAILCVRDRRVAKRLRVSFALMVKNYFLFVYLFCGFFRFFRYYAIISRKFYRLRSFFCKDNFSYSVRYYAYVWACHLALQAFFLAFRSYFYSLYVFYEYAAYRNALLASLVSGLFQYSLVKNGFTVPSLACEDEYTRKGLVRAILSVSGRSSIGTRVYRGLYR